MVDTGQDITVKDEMTIQELIDLEGSTDKRFSFEVDASGTFAIVYWVNFYKTTQGYRQKDTKSQAWKLLEHNTKKVAII